MPVTMEVGKALYGTNENLGKYTVETVSIEDVYATKQIRQDIGEQVSALMAVGFYGNTDIADAVSRKRKKIDMNNPATQAIAEELPSFCDWLDLVPTAGALDALYNPTQETFVSGKPIDERLRQWLFGLEDAVGIRSRGNLLSQFIEQELSTSNEPLSIVSLACGGGQPVLKGVASAMSSGVARPTLTMADIDPKALELTRLYTRSELGDEDGLTLKRMNILRPQGIAAKTSEVRMSELAPSALRRALQLDRLEREGFDIVEATGIVEYLQDDNWTHKRRYRYGDWEARTPMAGARDFLKNAFELVKPGGVLLVSNMLDTHPQLGFTLNTIQWPHIQPRSIEQVVRLFREAGIEDGIEVLVPDDGVYANYRVRKIQDQPAW